MHTFKYSILFIGVVFAHDNEIQIPTLDPIQLAASLDSLLIKQKSLTLEYHLKSYDVEDEYSNYYTIDSYKNADSVILQCDDKLNDRIIEKILNPFMKIPIGNQFNQLGEGLVSKYYFINENPNTYFGFIDKQKLGALIILKPNFNSFIAGAFGLNQRNNQIKIVGELDIDFENFLRNAEQIKIVWKKNKDLSQKIKFSTFVPHLLGTEIGCFWRYDFENYNGFYTKSEQKIMLHAFLPILNNTQIGYNKGKILSTQIGKNSGYVDGNFLGVSIKSELDTRDDRLLPLSGQFFNLMIDGGLDGETRFIKTGLKHQVFFHIYNNTYANFQTHINGINYSSGLVPKSRYVYLGGASSFRGFNEQEFAFTQYQIFTMELINQQKSPLQLKSFIDLGSNKFNLTENYLFGYGLGIKQLNKNSIVSFEYSLGSKKQKGGKIHIKWSAKL